MYVIFCLAGLFLLFVGIPGNFFVVAGAAIIGSATGWQNVTVIHVLALFAVFLGGETVDFLSGLLVAKGKGSSKWGMAGALLGGIAGAIVGTPVPLIGNVTGAFLGAFLGSFLLEWLRSGRLKNSLRIGYSVLVGRIISTSLKVALSVGMMSFVVTQILKG